MLVEDGIYMSLGVALCAMLGEELA